MGPRPSCSQTVRSHMQDVPLFSWRRARRWSKLSGEAHHTSTRVVFSAVLSNAVGRVTWNIEHLCAWLKFHKHQASLLNKRIPLHLRCKLFSSVVSPSALYSLSTTPLTETQLERLDATQRRMLRKMVGWVRFDGESWEEVGHRMKARLAAAMEKSQVQSWSNLRNSQKDKMTQRLRHGDGPSLACLAHAWMPESTRPRGRPRQRWSDHSVH